VWWTGHRGPTQRSRWKLVYLLLVPQTLRQALRRGRRLLYGEEEAERAWL
jgi:hypothetical protein